MNKVAVYRKEHFCAAHRLHNEHWSEKQNEQVFGLCNNANYHGHNYEVIVKVIGVPNKDTGFVLDTKWLSNLIQQKVVKKFDHKNLNLVILYETERNFVEYPA